MEIEICGYKELEISCGQSLTCDGYNNRCPMYTTYGHVMEFEEMFRDDRDYLLTKIKRCDLINYRRRGDEK